MPQATTTLLEESARSYAILCAEEVRPTDAGLHRRLQRQALIGQFSILAEQAAENYTHWLIVAGSRPEQALIAGSSQETNPKWVASGQICRDDYQQLLPRGMAGTLGVVLSLLSTYDFRSMFFPIRFIDFVPAKLSGSGNPSAIQAWGLDIGNIPGILRSLETDMLDDALVPALFAA